jgi:hypothetical protein
MRKSLLCSLFLALFLCTSVLNASAEDVYVKNKPFEGTVVGSGLSSELSLKDLGTALGMEVKQSEGQWLLGETPLAVREVDGRILVSLSALKEAGFKVIRSAELGTIDINTGMGAMTAKSEQKRMAESGWGGGSKPTLVYFGANW